MLDSACWPKGATVTRPIAGILWWNQLDYLRKDPQMQFSAWKWAEALIQVSRRAKAARKFHQHSASPSQSPRETGPCVHDEVLWATPSFPCYHELENDDPTSHCLLFFFFENRNKPLGACLWVETRQKAHPAYFSLFTENNLRWELLSALHPAFCALPSVVTVLSHQHVYNCTLPVNQETRSLPSMESLEQSREMTQAWVWLQRPPQLLL